MSDRIYDAIARNSGRQQDIEIGKKRTGRHESRILWQGDYDDREANRDYQDHEHEPYACVKVINLNCGDISL